MNINSTNPVVLLPKPNFTIRIEKPYLFVTINNTKNDMFFNNIISARLNYFYIINNVKKIVASQNITASQVLIITGGVNLNNFPYDTIIGLEIIFFDKYGNNISQSEKLIYGNPILPPTTPAPIITTAAPIITTGAPIIKTTPLLTQPAPIITRDPFITTGAPILKKSIQNPLLPKPNFTITKDDQYLFITYKNTKDDLYFDNIKSVKYILYFIFNGVKKTVDEFIDIGTYSILNYTGGWNLNNFPYDSIIGLNILFIDENGDYLSHTETLEYTKPILSATAINIDPVNIFIPPTTLNTKSSINDKYNLYLLSDPNFNPSYKNVIYITKYENEPMIDYTIPDNTVLKIVEYPTNFKFNSYININNNIELLFITYIKIISTDYINRILSSIFNENTTINKICIKSEITIGNLSKKLFNIIDLCYLAQNDYIKDNAYFYILYYALMNNINGDINIPSYKYYKYYKNNNNNYFLIIPFSVYNSDSEIMNKINNNQINVTDINSLNEMTFNNKIYRINIDNKQFLFDIINNNINNNTNINILIKNITINFDKLIRIAELVFAYDIHSTWYINIGSKTQADNKLAEINMEIDNIRKTIDDVTLFNLTM